MPYWLIIGGDEQAMHCDVSTTSVLLTPNSTTRASIMLPITVMKSNVFQGSLKKFCNQYMYLLKFTQKQQNTVLQQSVPFWTGMDLSFYWYTRTHTSCSVTKYTQNKFISAYFMRQGFWRQTPQKWKIIWCLYLWENGISIQQKPHFILKFSLYLLLKHVWVSACMEISYQ